MKKLALFLLLFSGFAFGQCPKLVNRAAISATSNGDNTVITADPNNRIVVWQFYIVNSHATQDENVTWKDGSTAESGAYLLKAAGGSHTASCSGTAWLVAPVNSAVILNLSAAGTIKGEIYYSLEQP